MKIKIKTMIFRLLGNEPFHQVAERERAMCEARRGWGRHGGHVGEHGVELVSRSRHEVGSLGLHGGGRVCRVPRDFQHPGGRELMDRHDRTDIGYLFHGTAEEGRSTRSSHGMIFTATGMSFHLASGHGPVGPTPHDLDELQVLPVDAAVSRCARNRRGSRHFGFQRSDGFASTTSPPPLRS